MPLGSQWTSCLLVHSGDTGRVQQWLPVQKPRPSSQSTGPGLVSRKPHVTLVLVTTLPAPGGLCPNLGLQRHFLHQGPPGKSRIRNQGSCPEEEMNKNAVKYQPRVGLAAVQALCYVLLPIISLNLNLRAGYHYYLNFTNSKLWLRV